MSQNSQINPENPRSYLAEDEDDVATAEGELVGIVPPAIPQSLVIIGIILLNIFWGKKENEGVGLIN